MRLLKILLLLPPLAYGAAMGYLWYEVKSTADKAAEFAAPFAELRYGSIHVSLTGDEIGLDDVVLKPTMTSGELRIEQFRMRAPHIGYFVSAGMDLKQGELPEKLDIQIGRLHLDLNSELFSLLEQTQQQVAATQPDALKIFSDLDALGCGQIEKFTLSDYRQMGMGEMIVNAGASLRYDEALNTATVAGNADAKGLYEVNFRTEFKTGPRIRGAVAEAGIPKSTLTYRDTGYYKLRNAYCAKWNDGNPETYVDRHVQLVSQTLGATLPEKTLAAYRHLMLKGGSLEAQMNPSADLDPNALPAYSPETLIHMLGLRLVLNGHPLDLGQIDWHNGQSQPHQSVQDRKATAEAPQPAPPAAPRPSVRTTARTEPTDRAPASRTIPVLDAGKYIDSMVEVTTVGGKVHSGQLEDVTNSRVYLMVKRSRGTMSYPVEFRKITEIRVFD